MDYAFSNAAYAKEDRSLLIQSQTELGKPLTDGQRSPKSPNRPTNLIIPQLIVQQSSPTKDCIPIFIHGSPPPRRGNMGDVHILITSASPEVNDEKT